MTFPDLWNWRAWIDLRDDEDVLLFSGAVADYVKKENIWRDVIEQIWNRLSGTNIWAMGSVPIIPHEDALYPNCIGDRGNAQAGVTQMNVLVCPTTGNNRLLMIGVAIRGGVAVTSIMSDKSEAATKLDHYQPGGDNRIELWYIKNFDIATTLLTIYLAASQSLSACTATYVDVDQATTFRQDYWDDGNSGQASIQVADGEAEQGDVIFDVLGIQSSDGLWNVEGVPDHERLRAQNGPANASYIGQKLIRAAPMMDALTWEMWVETSETQTAGTIASYAVTGDTEHVRVYDIRNLVVDVNGVSSGQTGISVNDGVPHHVALTWRKSDGLSRLLIDAKERWSGTLSTSALTAGGTLIIGQDQDSVGGGFEASEAYNGKVWDFMWWGVERTEAQILAWMNRRFPSGDFSHDGVHLHWEMDDGTGTEVVDQNGGVQDGVLYGSQWVETETRFFSDITSYIPPGLRWSSILGKALDTVYLTMEGWEGTKPVDWDEIMLEVKLSAEEDYYRLFDGYVMSIGVPEGGDLLVDFSIGASDLAYYFDKVRIKVEYDGEYDQAIIQDLIETYVPWIGAIDANIDQVVEYPVIRFNRITLRDVLDQLADNAKADWYVDADRHLHFFQTEVGSAPFDLSDDPDLSTTFPFYGFVKHMGGARVVNRIEVLGGNYLSADEEFIIAGTGKDNRVLMPFKVHAPVGESSILVWRNDGTEGTPSWTVMTVKVGYIDELGGADEVLHYYQEAVLEQLADWPNLPNAVKIQGRYDVPLRARVRDYASFAHYKKWFDDILVDDTITEKEIARLAGQARLTQYSMGTVAITCHCMQPGLRAGQIQHITASQWAIDSDYLIQRVDGVAQRGGYIKFALAHGVFNPDLIDLLLSLFRKTKDKAPTWREDEMLDELLEYAEDVNVSESTDITATQGPYGWGTVVTKTEARWSFFVWG